MVRVGSNYADRGGIKLIGTQYTFHPQYKQDFDYDIGILRVSPPMVLNYRVAAVELPEQDSDMGDNRYGDYITWVRTFNYIIVEEVYIHKHTFIYLSGNCIIKIIKVNYLAVISCFGKHKYGHEHW